MHARKSINEEKYHEKILTDEDPKCPNCGGWVKPNIVFFGGQLPPRFFDEAEMDCTFCDLLVCMGTSLEVYPFAGKEKTFSFFPNTKISTISKALWMPPITQLQDC